MHNDGIVRYFSHEIKRKRKFKKKCTAKKSSKLREMLRSHIIKLRYVIKDLGKYHQEKIAQILCNILSLMTMAILILSV